MKIVFALVLATGTLLAQGRLLTLREAEETALRQHPALAAARLGAEAQSQVPQQIRSVQQPQISASTSAVGATEQARIGAGAFQNPVIFSRLGIGLGYNQLLFDFGRTRLLAESATARAKAEGEFANTVQAQVLLQVRQAYFAALRTQAVLRVVDETVTSRQLVYDQVTALANAKLKSGLDLSFAEVSLSEAKLMAANARNDADAAQSDLAVALGLPQPEQFTLQDPSSIEPVTEEASALIANALQARPELAMRRLDLAAAQRIVDAEGKLNRPTVSGVGAAGVIPVHGPRLEKDTYAAGGVVVGLNFLNGGLFKARQAEAALRLRAAEQRVREWESRIARDVSVAFLSARNAFERLQLTGQLLNSATQALNLAQSRYDLGLSSIVELSQAQLAKTAAEIQQTSARYEYQARKAILDYQSGAIR